MCVEYQVCVCVCACHMYSVCVCVCVYMNVCTVNREIFVVKKSSSDRPADED